MSISLLRRTPTLGRDARLLVAGQIMSTFGDTLLIVGVPLMVLQVSGSAVQVGFVVALTQAPTLLGFLARRLRRRTAGRSLLVAFDLLRMVAVALVAALLAIGPSTLPAVYALLTVTSALAALAAPTRGELATHVVSPDELMRLNSYDRSGEALAVAAGAGAGGVLVAVSPIWTIFAIDAVTFLLSAATILLLSTAVRRGRAGALDTTTERRPRGALLRNRAISLVLLAEALTSLALGAFLALFVVFVIRELSAGSAVYGFLEMTQAAAAGAAGLLLARATRPLAESQVPVIGYLGMGVVIVVLGLTSSLPLVFGLMVALGAVNILYAVGVRTLFQRVAAGGALLDVLAAESVLSRGATVAGALAGAALLASGAGTAGMLLSGAGALVIFSGLVARTGIAARSTGGVPVERSADG